MTRDEVAAALAARTPGTWRDDPDGNRYLLGPDGEDLHWDTEGLGATWANEADARAIVVAVNLADPLWHVAEAARVMEHSALRVDCDDDLMVWAVNSIALHALRAALADLDAAMEETK